ncbi:membrane-bound lytic murein transglycosylase A [uncultured Gammaproteobacteria bacterium]
MVFTPVPFPVRRVGKHDRTAEVLPALIRSCAKLTALAPTHPLGPNGMAGTAGAWRPPCAALAKLSGDDDQAARSFLESWFVPHAATNNVKSEGLFTGYYEIEARGSLSPDERYSAPIYRRPPDLVTVDLGEFNDKYKGERTAGRVDNGRLRPYATRAQIEAGALAGRELDWLWLDDPIDSFFLQIQGSGRITLPDGRLIRVGFAGQNGHRYYAIGRDLIDQGWLSRETTSLQTIRAWLRDHPAEAPALMNRNPSYVFFEEVAGEAPIGSQGVPLTPGRSLAVDRGFIPLGVPVWLDAEGPINKTLRVRRLLVAQDTGGAIRGPVRGDVFWGHGVDAERNAGFMKSEGRYFVLLPRTAQAQP